MKPFVAIIDIDTTIANNDHRAELLQKHCVICGGAKRAGHHEQTPCPTCCIVTRDKVSQASWDTFLRADLVALDEPVRKAQDVIRAWREAGVAIHFITGRDEALRDVTSEWLRKYFGWDASKEALKMRGDVHLKVPASQYKEDAFKELVAEKGLDGCFFLFCEDDPYVFRTYAKYGMCLKCPEGWDHFLPDVATGVGHWQRR